MYTYKFSHKLYKKWLQVTHHRKCIIVASLFICVSSANRIYWYFCSSVDSRDDILYNIYIYISRSNIHLRYYKYIIIAIIIHINNIIHNNE